MNFKHFLFSVVLCLSALFAGINANATTCPNAVALTGPLPILNRSVACGSANDITTSNVTTSCGNGQYYGGPEALYTYTPTANQTISISFAGGTPTNHTSIFVFAGCPTTPGTTCAGAANSGFGSNTDLTVTLISGTTYYIMFDTDLQPSSPCPGTFSITGCQLPAALNLSSITQTTANLSFTGGASNYQVEWGTSSLGSSNNTRVFTTTNSYNLTGLLQATNYNIWVRSICAAGDTSLWSVYTSFATNAPCGTPTAVTTTAITSTGVTLNWMASATGASSGYQYEIRNYGAAGSGSSGRTAFGTIASGTLTATTGGLVPNTAYKAYVRANCGFNSFSNWTIATSFTTSPTCFPPTAAAVAVATATGATFTWTAPAAAPTNGYRYEVRTFGSGNTGLAASGTTAGGVTTVTVAGLTPATVYTFCVQGSCGAGNFSPCTAGIPFFTPCVAPTLTGTTAATRCGLGTVSLTATGTGNTLYWYADTAVATRPLAVGSPFTTPVTGATTTYYVSAVDTANYTGLGNTTIPQTVSSAYERGIVLETSQAFRLNTAQFYSTLTSGTIAGTAKLVDDATGNVLTTTNFSFPTGGAAQWYTLNLNWNLAAGKTYRLLAIFTSGSVSRHTGSSTFYWSTAYTNLGPAGRITRGYDMGGYPHPYSDDYNYFHNLNITAICASPHTAVVATVTPAPAISPNTSADTICRGNAVTLSAFSNNLGYTYTWTPATAPATGNSVIATPTATTKYYVNAVDNSAGINTGCANKDSVTVTVNQIPVAPTLFSTTTSLCLGDTLTINATGSEEVAYRATPLFSEDFNGAATAFISSDYGSSAPTSNYNPSLGQWQVRAPVYNYGSTAFASPTGTSFMIANASEAGIGVTRVALTSPLISTIGVAKLALAYKHHYKKSNGDSAVVEASPDGGVTWIILKNLDFYSNFGAADAFIADTILLQNFTGTPNMKFRFRYRSFYGYYWAIDDVKLLYKGVVSLSWLADPPTGAGLPASAAVASAANTTIHPVPTAAGIYSYTVQLTSSLNTCARTLTTATIAVSTNPFVSLGNDTSICAGKTITLNAGNPGSTFLWSTGATTQTIAVANTGTYSVKIITAGGCMGRDTIAISRKPLPVAGTISVTGQSPTFTFTAAGNQNESQRGWLFGDGTGNTTGNPATASHTYTTNGTFTVKFYALNDCGSDSASATVIVSNVGVQNVLLAGEVALFPNPAAKYFVVQNNSAQKLKTITVLNVVGAVVQEVKANNPKEQRISIEGLAAGSYLVRITLDGTTVVRRLQILP